MNSSSLSAGLQVWERLKPKHDASSVFAAGCQALMLDGFEPLILALGLGPAALGEKQPLY